jgi:uracil-DNA glycosylase family 4
VTILLQWKELKEESEACVKCGLCKSRTHVVFGEGNINSKLMFIGEAPGADEDRTGRPFVGRAGQLLTKALSALDLIREKDYYICNVCKCRPEKNRTPMEEEARACIPYLRNQVALVKPKIIVLLGAIAMKYVMEEALNNKDSLNEIESEHWKEALRGTGMKITRDRGKWLRIKNFSMMSTFHPAALLRDENKKKLFWEDLKNVKVELKNII